MKRHIAGLSHHANADPDFLDGVFLVRVERVFYRWHPQRPYFVLRFAVIEPQGFANRQFAGRLYCSERALWKFNWFLRDFGYDPDLLGREEVDEKAIVGLRGIVRTSHASINGRAYLNLEGFAPAADWEELARAVPQEAARGL